MLAALDLGLLRGDLALEVCVAHAQAAHHPAVEHPYPRRDGADRELGIPRCPDLAGHDDVERRAERPGGGLAHDHAAARDREHDRVRAGEWTQGLPQPLAGLRAVGEDHGRSASPCDSSISRRESSSSSLRRLSPITCSGGGMGFRIRR